jgi:hypothetical protein
MCIGNVFTVAMPEVIGIFVRVDGTATKWSRLSKLRST